jgi:hypothetical protein
MIDRLSKCRRVSILRAASSVPLLPSTSSDPEMGTPTPSHAIGVPFYLSSPSSPYDVVLSLGHCG